MHATPIHTSSHHDHLGGLVEDARAWFQEGHSRAPTWRLRQLEGLVRLVNEREEEIYAALTEDLGKPRLEAYGSELAYIRNEAELARRRLSGWLKPEKVRVPLIAQPGRASILREPLGVVLIISPWNYPFHLALAPLIGAVAAGNAVVLKPSEVAPATSALLAKFLPDYLDPRGIQVVEGAEEETQHLLQQRFDHIFFTGSPRVARVIMRAAAEHLTPVTLELGGKSPCLVDRSADLGVSARRIVWGKYFNAGQTCLAPDYILVHEAVEEALVEQMAEAVLAFYGEDPQQSPDYGRIINQEHIRRLERLLRTGGRAVVGGVIDPSDRYFAPTVLQDVAADAPVMQDEIFGPILPVCPVSDMQEAMRFVNARPKPLALYLFARDRLLQQEVLERTSSGGAVVNHVMMHVSVPDLPFGGVGQSGMGAYHGRASFETFSHRKAVLKKSLRFEPDLMYPPYSANKKRWIRRIF